jgi:hypothetical protein
MSRKWIISLALCVVAGCLCTVALVHGTAVTAQQQTLPIQWCPPGEPSTLQTAFCQTSTGGAQANTVTVPALAGKTIYVTGIEVTGSGATAASNVAITLASSATTQANWTFVVPAGATLQATPLVIEFQDPIVGLAPGNTAVLTVGTFGSGNTGASVTIHGFYQ